MEETSWRRHLGGGRQHKGASWRHLGDIREASRRTSWKSHHGGSILEEGSIMEEHPESTLETYGKNHGKHLGGSWRAEEL